MNIDDLFIPGNDLAVDARSLYTLLAPREFFLSWVEEQLADRINGDDFVKMLNNRWILSRSTALDIAIQAAGPVGREVRLRLIKAEEELVALSGGPAPGSFGEEFRALFQPCALFPPSD